MMNRLLLLMQYSVGPTVSIVDLLIYEQQKEERREEESRRIPLELPLSRPTEEIVGNIPDPKKPVERGVYIMDL